MAYTPQQIKKALLQAGLQVYRTRGEEIFLAERVRDNLIMDSGVRVKITDPLEVRVILRAQGSDFPGIDEEGPFFDFVRELASAAIEIGFAEVETRTVPITDPVDQDRILDTFYEMMLSMVTHELERTLEVLRLAMALNRVVAPKRLSLMPTAGE